MTRFTILSLVLSSFACASQPICKPWSPDVAAAAAPAAAAPASTPAIVDDGSVVVAAASEDEAWTSVVGEAPQAAPAAAPRRRTRVAAADPSAAPAMAPTAAKAPPAPPAAKPAATKTAPAAAPAATKTAVAAAPAAAKPAAETKPAKPAANPKLGEAKSFFAGRCVPCHGASGRGDGPAGGALNPKPRNFTDRSWQKSVTDTHIEKVIFQGGPSVGKSPLMPAHADLKDPTMLAAMREVVRGFAR